MPELRWILIVFGLALLIGIYLWGRRSSSSSSAADERHFRDRPEPVLEAAPPYEEADDERGFDEPQFEEPLYEESGEEEPAESQPDHAQASVSADEFDEEIVDDPNVKERTEPPAQERRQARIEPTLSDESETAELPARTSDEPSGADASAPAAPTLSMSSTPAPRRIERRKIIALRLAVPQRIPGAQLREALDAEALQHGKYQVFHRLDEHGAAIFSVASMVEPGTFDLEKMPQETYPGVTLFAQLPGPTAGMFAFNELVNCSRRLHAALGGTLQDERGVPLTVHRIERIRQEIREFEQRMGAEAARAGSTLTASP